MRIKVHGGVIGGNSRGLCVSCEDGAVREFANNDIQIFCGSWEFHGSGVSLVPKPVTRCSQYKPVGTIKRPELEKIAWYIDINNKNGKIGFSSPADRAKEE